jgi:hypothetical protein
VTAAPGFALLKARLKHCSYDRWMESNRSPTGRRMVTLSIAGLYYEYHANAQHWNGATNKSQWRIRKPEEFDIFATAIAGQWGLGNDYWGLYRPSGLASYLGVDRDHETPVFLARFVGHSPTAVWHGYPVNHREDTPKTNVLNLWLEQSILPPAKIAKIQRRKPCAL